MCLLLYTREHYITMVTWLSPQRVAVRWVNRAQNISVLTLCDVITAHCVQVRRWKCNLTFPYVQEIRAPLKERLKGLNGTHLDK